MILVIFLEVYLFHHSIQDCPFPPPLNEIKNFKASVPMHYTANACHFFCDLPQSICNISQHAVGHPVAPQSSPLKLYSIFLTSQSPIQSARVEII
jgi:hypothetical protein